MIGDHAAKPRHIFIGRVSMGRNPEGYKRPNSNHSWFWVVGFYVIDFPSFGISLFFLRSEHLFCPSLYFPACLMIIHYCELLKYLDGVRSRCVQNSVSLAIRDGDDLECVQTNNT